MSTELSERNPGGVRRSGLNIQPAGRNSAASGLRSTAYTFAAGLCRLNFPYPKGYRGHYRSVAHIAGRNARRGRARSRLCAHARSWKGAEDLRIWNDACHPDIRSRSLLDVPPPFGTVSFASHDESLPRTRSASRAAAAGRLPSNTIARRPR